MRDEVPSSLLLSALAKWDTWLSLSDDSALPSSRGHSYERRICRFPRGQHGELKEEAPSFRL